MRGDDGQCDELLPEWKGDVLACQPCTRMSADVWRRGGGDEESAWGMGGGGGTVERIELGEVFWALPIDPYGRGVIARLDVAGSR